MEAREERGLTIAALFPIKRKGNAWVVPSQSGNGKYTVVPHPEHFHCSCPDHETRGIKCKHLYAVEFAMKREQAEDGSVTETREIKLTEKRTTYPQNWRAYNRAQTTEKSAFRTLLHNLCKGLQDPPSGNGRPRLPLADAIFAAIYKVYSTVSARRFMTDMREACDGGCISRCPCYNSILGVLEDPNTFNVLRSLVVASSQPLKALETNFACDSSGFSGSRYDRWFDHKYGKEGKPRAWRAWVKCHIMTGTRTNVVTAVEIHEQNAADVLQLPDLLETTQQAGFNVENLAADMGYSSRTNIDTIHAAGVFPLIPYKARSNPPPDGSLWEKMFHYFSMNREEFMGRYHVRSNVESTFSAVKRKFGDSVRSKSDVAMKNEVLAKLVCHNICCIIHEMHESGVDPTFWAESTAAQQVHNN
ncbi:MAG TPA: transposase [Planctomycetaceae bacterium]|nr:transposase [Planctomycetaceae bacterium]